MVVHIKFAYNWKLNVLGNLNEIRKEFSQGKKYMVFFSGRFNSCTKSYDLERGGPPVVCTK